MRTNDIKRLVEYYIKKFNTRNPFELAKCLNVEVQLGHLGSRAGCYMFLKNHKCVFLNEDLEEHELNLVMAHELAHSILHRKENKFSRKCSLAGSAAISRFNFSISLPDTHALCELL